MERNQGDQTEKIIRKRQISLELDISDGQKLVGMFMGLGVAVVTGNIGAGLLAQTILYATSAKLNIEDIE